MGVNSLSFVKQNGKGFGKGSNFKILESSSYRKEAVTLTFLCSEQFRTLIY